MKRAILILAFLTTFKSTWGTSPQDQSSIRDTLAANETSSNLSAISSKVCITPSDEIVVNASVHVNGTTTTRVLVVTGGADVAEPFPLSDNEIVSPGTVVVIDGDHPGFFKMSQKAHDTRVAGVVSGAGGINPGLTLRQEGMMAEGPIVALCGRVYVKATTANGPIEAGDLLTTSDLPGHAMKVVSREKASGAIIGKAITSLREGEGLVLILINLL
jgi:hypothetical protein